MSRFFESRFFTGLEKLVDLFIIGLYFLVCSIPIFTIGAATTAMYYAIHKSVFQNRGYTTEFFKSFKSNFKQSTLSWLIFLVFFGLGSADLYITRDMIVNGEKIGNAWIVFLVMMIVASLWSLYHFVYISRFENGFKESFKVSGVLMILNLPKTVIILVISLVFMYLIYCFPVLFVFAPGLYMAAVHPLFEKSFRPYMSEEDAALEEERDMSANM